MRNLHLITAGLVTLLLITSANSIRKLYGRNEQNFNPRNMPRSGQQWDEHEGRFPTTDYDAPEQSDPEQRAARRRKSRRYNNSSFVSRNPSPRDAAVSLRLEGALDFPALPVAESDVIVSGDVVGAQAHLSEDKTNVYSEFSVHIDTVFKQGDKAPLTKNDLIYAERLGGFVKYPGGRRLLHRVVGFGMPRTGTRCLFFLKEIEARRDYRIVTAYEMGADGVSPLDSSRQFETYRGFDEAAFIRALRDAIAKSAPPGE